MASHFEYIERYFGGGFSSREIVEFENKIFAEPGFAGDLVFYGSAMDIARDQINENRRLNFRRIYDECRELSVVKERDAGWRSLWYYLAAAVIAAIVMGVYLFYPGPSTVQLADRYITRHLQSLPVNMNVRGNKLTPGVILYNEGKFLEALSQFERILPTEPSNIKANEYAGITSLRLGQYEKAVSFFSKLALDTNLHANPGKFYLALTLLKRGLAGDEYQAKKLLKEIVKTNPDSNKEARDLLEQL